MGHRVPGEPLSHRSLHLSGSACQDCAKRKSEENGVKVSKKPRRAGTGPPAWLGVPATGPGLTALAVGGRRGTQVVAPPEAPTSEI